MREQTLNPQTDREDIPNRNIHNAPLIWLNIEESPCIYDSMLSHRLPSLAILIVTLLFSPFSASAYEPVKIVGANGKSMEFAGVKEAKPEGIVLLMNEGGKPMLVLWKSLDLEALKNHETIYTAYKDATTNRKTIPIGLGYYEDMVSEDTFLKNFNKILMQKHEFEVPKLSDFFEHKDNDSSFLSTNYGEDKNAAKRSKRFVKEYEDLLQEFFLVSNPRLNTSTTTWHYSGHDPFVIVKEATLDGHKSIELSTFHVIEFFANKSNSSRPRCSKYFSAYPENLRPLIRLIEEQANIVNDGRLLVDASKQSNYKYLLNGLQSHLEGMLKTNTLNTSIERDFSNFIKEFGSN